MSLLKPEEIQQNLTEENDMQAVEQIQSSTIEPIADMKAPAKGDQIGGGTYVGDILVEGVVYGLIVAPKFTGDFSGIWHKKAKLIKGADSPNNGRKNTEEMVAADCPIALEVRDHKIGGFDDWHIPSRDELEIMYRQLKPTAYENANWCGVNASSVPVQNLYTASNPSQTTLRDFQEGGTEALEPTWYWSSTQYGQYSAWVQHFNDGTQDYTDKYNYHRARAVRWIKLSDLSIQ
jgi:hypothetical protein